MKTGSVSKILVASVCVDGYLQIEILLLHCWGDLLGGLCQSGFVLEDVLEPKFGDSVAQPGTFGYRGHYIPPYIQFKARRTDSVVKSEVEVWTPDV